MTSGSNDLSISELSLSDQTLKPFTLLATQEPETDTEEPVAQEPQRHSAKVREEKLQSDIFILKKLNASFELFNEALQDTGSANQRLAAQLDETDALLDKYVTILSRSEDYSRLIFDEKWEGAEVDEDALEEEERQAEERARREAEEQAIRAQQEQERLEREKQDRLKAEQKERVERDKSERAIRGVIRGVRGSRPSTRGMPGTATGSARTVDTHTNTSRGVPKRQPPTSTRASGSNITRGISRPT
ncbi:hypothetical protein BYT27DRAFT_7185768 [Phlegmacium glaucopus]|nr:hypothetical protein BYT27DRAFT_7185768 [Phlegmacium glaucopus]